MKQDRITPGSIVGLAKRNCNSVIVWSITKKKRISAQY